MLKKNFRNRFSRRKKSELKITPGESLRDAMIAAGMKTVTDSAYAPGNSTEKLLSIGSNLGTAIDRTTELVLGSESGTSLARITFKATKDISRGDAVCTALCLISGTCEAIALGCSTIKIIPFRGRIFVGAKVISKSCMTYRNLCAGEGC